MGTNDEMGQSQAEINNVIDNIFKVICGVNVHKANKFWLGAYGPTQLQPIWGHPFLLSPCNIPCYKIDSTDCKKNYKELIDNEQLVDDFNNLCDGFTFVDSWDDAEITPDTFRIYARNVPAKEALYNFIQSVEQIYAQVDINKRKCINLHQHMYSHQEWTTANVKTSYKEVAIPQAPKTIYYYEDIKCIRRQYGLRYYITGTIHNAMGDTYNRMAISVSDI
eukprot:8559092-Ditylum_brightwellii.AAC.1